MKLTKQNIEAMAKEVMDFLIKEELDGDVHIYYNNKRMKNTNLYNDKEDKYKVTGSEIVIEEDVSPLDYFEYVNKYHILSMSFEGSLYDSLNYSGYKEDELNAIFDKYGVYFELGNAWNLSVYPDSIDEEDIEYTDYESEKEEKYPEEEYIYLHADNVPSALMNIMKVWYKLSEAEGDGGSCVLNAGFRFKYNGKLYKMASCSPWQGSLSWEANKDKIEQLLKDIGCTDIHYDWGNMD